MKQKFILFMALSAMMFVTLFSCNSLSGKKNKATFTAKNLVAVDSFSAAGYNFPAGNVKMEITIADSLETITKEFSNKTPVTETFTYDVADGDVMTVRLASGPNSYTYFLQGGDNVETVFNNKAEVEKSTFNGDSTSIALIFAGKEIPDYAIESFALDMKDPDSLTRVAFDSTFQTKYKAALQKVKSEVEKSFADKKITETMHYTLLKNIEYEMRGMWWGKGMEPLKWDDRSMGIGSYRGMPEVMIETNHLIKMDETGPHPEQFTRLFDSTLADKNYPPKSRYMMLRAFIKEMGKFAPELIKPSIAKIPDEKIRKKYDEIYTKTYMLDMDKYRADSANINLLSYDRTNGVTTFSQLMEKLKGKVVYVDFWASWCGPCRGEMPASHKLTEELKGQPIEFVYLSTDAAYTDWAKAAAEEGFVGNENSKLILNTSASTLFKSWNVDGIPRYMIFDKTGKLVNADAPRPSDEKTKEILLSLAKK